MAIENIIEKLREGRFRWWGFVLKGRVREAYDLGVTNKWKRGQKTDEED